MMVDSQGRELLKRWLLERRVSQEAFGKMVGVSQSTVCNWSRGATGPDDMHRLAIAAATKKGRKVTIAPSSWFTEQDKAILENAEAIGTKTGTEG